MIKPEVKYVKKLKIRCPHCDYEWLSESQSDKRICCVKCKTSITLAPGSSLPEYEQQHNNKIEFRLASLVSATELSEQALLREIEFVAMTAQKFLQRSRLSWLPDWARHPREELAEVLDEMVAFERKHVNEIYHSDNGGKLES